MRTGWLVIGAVAVLSLASARNLPAQNPFKMTQRGVIANRDVFLIRAAAGGMTAEQRLERVNERLAHILGHENLHLIQANLVDLGNAVEIRVGRTLLVTVTRADADANDTGSIQALARVWLQNLRRALPRADPRARAALSPPTTHTAKK